MQAAASESHLAGPDCAGAIILSVYHDAAGTMQVRGGCSANSNFELLPYCGEAAFNLELLARS